MDEYEEIVVAVARELMEDRVVIRWNPRNPTQGYICDGPLNAIAGAAIVVEGYEDGTGFDRDSSTWGGLCRSDLKRLERYL